MASLWTKSYMQELDLNGRPLPGALAYFFLGGTTTPLNIFTEPGLNVPATNPVSTDAFGRWPEVYLRETDGFYAMRVVTPTGSQMFSTGSIPIQGSSGGGGGGGGTAVDPNALMKTGDVKLSLLDGPLAGFVRINLGTIGNGTSGASERANADTLALFTALWAKTAIYTVSGGRGSNALADFNAGKTLTLPNANGRAIVALAGNGSSGAVPIATPGQTTGAASQSQSITVAEENMPSHRHEGNTYGAGGHNDRSNADTHFAGQVSANGIIRAYMQSPIDVWIPDHEHYVETNYKGGNQPISFTTSTVQPSIGFTVYAKL